MEKITKRYTYNGKPEISVDSEINGISCSNFCTNCGKADCDDIRKALFKLAEYEDLEEQGKLLKLPCAVGDTYFEIETAFWRNKQECKGCRYYHTGSDVFRDDDCCLFEEEKWPSCAEIVEKRFENVKEIMSYIEDGSDRKSVFCTREEAEAALKEL